MFIDLINQPDFVKYDLSSVKGGEKRIYKSGIAIQQKKRYKAFFLSRYFAFVITFSGYTHLFVCVAAGIIGGSPCPPEIVKKIISEMGVKEITVSPLTDTEC